MWSALLPRHAATRYDCATRDAAAWLVDACWHCYARSQRFMRRVLLMPLAMMPVCRYAVAVDATARTRRCYARRDAARRIERAR